MTDKITKERALEALDGVACKALWPEHYHTLRAFIEQAPDAAPAGVRGSGGGDAQS